MGVCCIVFDIDGILFEFCMNFLNIEKNKILRIFFSKLHGFFTFHAISNIKKKKKWFKKIFGGGGGGVLNFFVLILYLKCGVVWGGVMFFSHFMLFPSFLEKKSWNTNQLFLI